MLVVFSEKLFCSGFAFGGFGSCFGSCFGGFFGCGSCTVEIGPNTSRGGWEKDVQTVACRAAR